MGRGFCIAVMALALVACGSDEPSTVAGTGGGTTTPPPPPPPPETAHDLANGCFLLKAGGSYVKSAAGGFTTAGTDAATAERFYLKPAGLSRYIFYTVDKRFLSGAGSAVTAAAAPSNGADWTFATPATGRFTASVADGSLATDGTGALVVADAPAELTFEGATGCAAYPEMPLGIGATYTGPAAGEAVIGFAEVHAHMAMGSDMSDGTGDRGPSAGGVMYGHAVNRFGVIEALKNCETMHGPNGNKSPEGPVLDGGQNPEHETQGWPTFVDWPARDSLLHQQMYYRWVERTYRAGLRLMVLHGTNIEALCDVAKKSAGDPNAECRDMDLGLLQVAYIKDMQDYIDAQHGGPGKGWFRIVQNPAEARQVIAQGKLAVVPGLEFSNIFHCNVTYTPEGGELHGCTKEQIDAEIEQAWSAGVRGVFPFHDVDSALGGTGIFSSVLNLVNYYGTKGYWKTYDCPNEGTDPEYYFYDAGAEMDTAFPEEWKDNPFGEEFITATQGNTPTYPPGRQCNAREVTDLGQYAIQAIMKKGFVLDIDHGSLKMKDYILDLADDTAPAYPTISAHGGHGGITWDQARAMVNNGGILYPSTKHGRGFKEFIDKVASIWPAGRPLAVGYGADQNGLANQPGPRDAPFTPVTYPFRLFEGAGWGPQFADAGIAPMEVELLKIPESDKFWNVDEVGVAHYGLIPDVIAQLVIEAGGDTKYTDALYNSAEAYLRLWEQTLQASALRPAPAP